MKNSLLEWCGILSLEHYCRQVLYANLSLIAAMYSENIKYSILIFIDFKCTALMEKGII